MQSNTTTGPDRGALGRPVVRRDAWSMHLRQFSKWFPAEADLSYESRLEAVRELGELFPG